MLSEAACLGFEYGFSRDFPEALVLWEAQFGDFANGAQIIIDQFLAAGEAKWGLLSGLVLLLPSRQQGPDGTLVSPGGTIPAAGGAGETCRLRSPSTAAQYFHLLRRQAMRKWRKPLVVFTPKSMLRHPDAMSTVAETSVCRSFKTVVADRSVETPPAAPRLQRQDRGTIYGSSARSADQRCGNRLRDQLYPWPERSRAGAGFRYVPQRERGRLGAGGAGQHGCAFVRDAAPAPDCARPTCDLHQTVPPRQALRPDRQGSTS